MAGSLGRGTVGISLASLLLAGLVAGGTPVRRAVTSEELVAPPEIVWGETEADEIAERAEFFFAERAFPRITIPDGAYERSVAQARKLRGDASKIAALRWSPLGPRPIDVAYPPIYQGKGPITGRVTSIATHPLDPDVAYAGGATGGVWKTTDGGVHWKPLFDDQPTLAVGAVAVDLRDPQTVYAGTGEGNQYYIPYFGMGLFRSTDAGSTWHKVKAPFDGCYFSDLIASAGMILATMRTGNNPALATQGRQPQCGAGGVWRSEDRGRTWTNVLPGIAWELAQDENDPEFVYAGVDGQGVFKSSDSGATWTPSLVGVPIEGESRVAVAVAPSDGQRLYAAIERPGTSDLMGLWTSSDGGTTWLPVPYSSQPCSYGGVIVDQSQCFYNFVMAVDGKDPETFYLGGVKLYRYQLGEIGPQNIGNGEKGIHVDQHALVADAAGRLWIGNDGGVYRTSDKGKSFDNLSRDLALTQFYPGISGSTAGPLLGGSQDNGTSMYTGGRRWTGVLGADGGYSAVDHDNPDVMYGSYQNLYLWKSIDGGKHWYTIHNGIVRDEPKAFIAPLVMHPRDASTLYAGTVRVYRTTNGASRWEGISPVFDGASVRAIGPAPSDTDTIYAGTGRGSVVVTRDGGTLWVNTALNGLPLRTPTDFAIHPTKPEVAYVTVSGFESGHVFKTTDAGGSWTDVSGDLPDSPANAVELDVRNDTLYVATDVGVFSSRDDGRTWRADSAGLPNVVVRDLLLDRRTGDLVAGTYGRGMWVADIGAGSVGRIVRAGNDLVVVRVYDGPSASARYPATPVGVCYGPRDIGCVRLPIVSGAVAIELEISDSTGQRVAASVYQYDPRDRYRERDFCGSTAKPVPLLEDVDSLGVWIYQGPCADGSPAAATRGEIKVMYVFPN